MKYSNKTVGRTQVFSELVCLGARSRTSLGLKVFSVRGKRTIPPSEDGAENSAAQGSEGGRTGQRGAGLPRQSGCERGRRSLSARPLPSPGSLTVALCSPPPLGSRGHGPGGALRRPSFEPVESELLRLRARLCRAGDPALDGGSRAPPEAGLSRFAFWRCQSWETGDPQGGLEGRRPGERDRAGGQQPPGPTHWAPRRRLAGQPSRLPDSHGCLLAPQGHGWQPPT